MTSAACETPSGSPVRRSFQAKTRSVVHGEIQTAPTATATSTEAARVSASTSMTRR